MVSGASLGAVKQASTGDWEAQPAGRTRPGLGDLAGRRVGEGRSGGGGLGEDAFEALLGYLHPGSHRSHERMTAVSESVVGLRISEGAIAAALARLATRAESAVAAIRDAAPASASINSDATGVRVDDLYSKSFEEVPRWR